MTKNTRMTLGYGLIVAALLVLLLLIMKPQLLLFGGLETDPLIIGRALFIGLFLTLTVCGGAKLMR